MDDISRVLHGLVQIFAQSPAITALVKPGNIIDITDAKWSMANPIKASPQAGDLPELIILPGDCEMNPSGRNSKVASLTQQFVMGITTDSLRIGGEASGQQVTLFSLKMAILGTLASTPPDLGFPGLVRSFGKVMPARDQGMIEKKMSFLGRDSRRWTSVAMIPVEMYWLPIAIAPA